MTLSIAPLKSHLLEADGQVRLRSWYGAIATYLMGRPLALIEVNKHSFWLVAEETEKTLTKVSSCFSRINHLFLKALFSLTALAARWHGHTFDVIGTIEQKTLASEQGPDSQQAYQRLIHLQQAASFPQISASSPSASPTTPPGPDSSLSVFVAKVTEYEIIFNSWKSAKNPVEQNAITEATSAKLQAKIRGGNNAPIEWESAFQAADNSNITINDFFELAPPTNIEESAISEAFKLPHHSFKKNRPGDHPRIFWSPWPVIEMAHKRGFTSSQERNYYQLENGSYALVLPEPDQKALHTSDTRAEAENFIKTICSLQTHPQPGITETSILNEQAEQLARLDCNCRRIRLLALAQGWYWLGRDVSSFKEILPKLGVTLEEGEDSLYSTLISFHCFIFKFPEIPPEGSPPFDEAFIKGTDSWREWIGYLLQGKHSDDRIAAKKRGLKS